MGLLLGYLIEIKMMKILFIVVVFPLLQKRKTIYQNKFFLWIDTRSTYRRLFAFMLSSFMICVVIVLSFFEKKLWFPKIWPFFY